MAIDMSKPAESNDTKATATILLVDDDSINLSVFGQALIADYKVLITTNGERALQLVQANPKPDLILLDIMMPGIDGYEVLRQLKANSETADIPVIFLTALSADINEEQGLELGAVDYIYKPCNLSILLARVKTQLELKKSRDWLKNQNAYLEAEIERRQQENKLVHMQLLQSEKLAAIGQLAAGIAHEINNPIGFVSSNMTTLGDYMADLFEMMDACAVLVDSDAIPTDTLERLRTLKKQKDLDFLRLDIPQLITESREGLARVKRIIQDLKSFSHVDENTWEWSDLHHNLDSTLNIIRNELKYHCSVHKHYADLPQIYCLPSQLSQVFMNLLINAAHAIKVKGDIDISTGQIGEEVWVEITDSGEGIPTDKLNRIFEPFFTTKPVGKGTGLGLSISQNIVKKHQGRIEVQSQMGEGTTFRVILPIQPKLSE